MTPTEQDTINKELELSDRLRSKYISALNIGDHLNYAPATYNRTLTDFNEALAELIIAARLHGRFIEHKGDR